MEYKHYSSDMILLIGDIIITNFLAISSSCAN